MKMIFNCGLSVKKQPKKMINLPSLNYAHEFDSRRERERKKKEKKIEIEIKNMISIEE